jgi:hypothetical protein
VRESGADGLVDVEHVRGGVPALRVESNARGRVVDAARAVLLEETDHARAAGLRDNLANRQITDENDD